MLHRVWEKYYEDGKMETVRNKNVTYQLLKDFWMRYMLNEWTFSMVSRKEPGLVSQMDV